MSPRSRPTPMSGGCAAAAGSARRATRCSRRSRAPPTSCSATTTWRPTPTPCGASSRRRSAPTPGSWRPSSSPGSRPIGSWPSGWGPTASASPPRCWSGASSTSSSTTRCATCSTRRRRACWCGPTCSPPWAASTSASRSWARTSTSAGGATWPAPGWCRRPRRASATSRRPTPDGGPSTGRCGPIRGTTRWLARSPGRRRSTRRGARSSARGRPVRLRRRCRPPRRSRARRPSRRRVARVAWVAWVAWVGGVGRVG